jgi:hypothetical protein
MSGTFSDFAYYNSEHLAAFSEFIHSTEIPSACDLRFVTSLSVRLLGRN